MKKLGKIVMYFLLLVAFLLVGLLTYIKTALPNVGEAPVLKIELTPDRVARGKYLANSVSVCMDCHSARDWSKFAGPMVANTLGSGGELFAEEFGFPGRYISKNITPYSLGKWSDGEIFRAITTGVSKDGSPLFPVMPHPRYGEMDKEDIYAIIAYLRSLPPIAKDVAPSYSNFPMNFIIHTIPKPANPQPMPSKSDQVSYGKYLFNAAACNECHTKTDKGAPIAGMESAGGFEFPLPTGVVVSANITPDNETGIGKWTEEQFVRRFKAYADSSYTPAEVKEGQFNSVMPWTMYATMAEEDLSAIHAYLKTVKPIKNQVVRFVAKK